MSRKPKAEHLTKYSLIFKKQKMAILSNFCNPNLSRFTISCFCLAAQKASVTIKNVHLGSLKEQKQAKQANNNQGNIITWRWRHENFSSVATRWKLDRATFQKSLVDLTFDLPLSCYETFFICKFVLFGAVSIKFNY
jgi:hypothetical protein